MFRVFLGMHMLKALERRLKFILRGGQRPKLDFFADGMGVRRKTLDHLSEPRFVEAWAFAKAGSAATWGTVPDIRWRAHTCVWAATQALHLDGDFVECGVNTGLLSMTVCHYLDFGTIDRTFWLYDTFNGIPAELLEGRERSMAEATNAAFYVDCHDVALKNFSPFPNARLVRGMLPATLSAEPKRIAYLSIDLNSATFERQTMDVLWDRLVPGALVVIDDYGFRGHEDQHEFWDDLARGNGVMVLSLPTGQGLLVKPAPGGVNAATTV